jgi:hypothetical protein
LQWALRVMSNREDFNGITDNAVQRSVSNAPSTAVIDFEQIEVK